MAFIAARFQIVEVESQVWPNRDWKLVVRVKMTFAGVQIAPEFV
jgi:hypothetical protein